MIILPILLTLFIKMYEKQYNKIDTYIDTVNRYVSTKKEKMMWNKGKIFIYWEQGWDDAPYICKMCLESWKKYNNDSWQIIELDKDRISQNIDMEILVPNFWKIQSIASRSDILRINLLKKYENSVWVDATTFCTRPLNDWITKNDSFFAFANPSNDRMVASWFLYSKKPNYIINKWCEEYNAYWINKTRPENYFQFHYIFNDLYHSDLEFKRVWDGVNHISANIPHKLKYKDKYEENIPKDIIFHIDNLQAPLYKLEHTEKSSLLLTNSTNNIFYYLAHFHGLI